MNSRNALSAAAVVAAVASLAACGADVKHGTITSKEFEPAQTSVYFQPVYGQKCVTRPVTVRVKVGSIYTYRSTTTRSCASYVSGHVPVYSHEDACYKLDLKNSSGDTGSVCVDKDAWNNAKVGGQW